MVGLLSLLTHSTFRFLILFVTKFNKKKIVNTFVIERCTSDPKTKQISDLELNYFLQTKGAPITKTSFYKRHGYREQSGGNMRDL